MISISRVAIAIGVGVGIDVEVGNGIVINDSIDLIEVDDDAELSKPLETAVLPSKLHQLGDGFRIRWTKAG